MFNVNVCVLCVWGGGRAHCHAMNFTISKVLDLKGVSKNRSTNEICHQLCAAGRRNTTKKQKDEQTTDPPPASWPHRQEHQCEQNRLPIVP